jgi:uncharacterized protein with ACT and thioredoxin-like domain
MPIGKEFTIRQEDKPGTLGKLCQALTDQNVNILAFQSFPSEKGKSSIHLVLDNHTAAKAVLDQHRVDYTGAREAGSPSGRVGTRRIAAGRRGNQHQLRLLRDRGGGECFDFDLRRTLPM